MNSAELRCPRCREVIGRDVGGSVCAACLLEEMLPTADGFSEPAASHVFGTDTPMVQRLGSYELLEEIGRGGMGVIYKARQAGLDRIVALKMLLAGEFADARARERLLREARIASRLTHPGIVTIHDVGEHDGRPYFAMEYVPGRNLAQQTRDGLLPISTAARYAEQLSRAVHYAHQHGVIHRDLKPANVLISPDDEPKLTDFGLTKSLVDATRSLESAGSPNYMAPEQADSSVGRTGTHTDVYGLGAILYHLLTGRPPAVGETLAETLRAVATGDVMAPRQLRPAVPRDLETIALRCLEKEPSRRYGSALEVAEELERWQRGEPILARPVSALERLLKWRRRYPVAAGLGLTCLLLLFGGLVGITLEWRRAEGLKTLAEANELAARRVAYAAEMKRASEALEKHDWNAVREVLETTRAKPGQVDLRGWEWRYLWHVSRIGAEGRFGSRPNEIASLSVLQDGRTVALGEREGGFSLWDPQEGRLVFELNEPINRVQHPWITAGAGVVCRVAAIPGSPLLAYTDCRGTRESWLRFWNVAERRLSHSTQFPGIPRHLAVSADGKWAACSLMLPDDQVFIVETSTGRVAATVNTGFSRYSELNTLAFSPDGRWLAVEDSRTACLRVVDWRTGEDRYRLALDQVFPVGVAFSPDGRWLAAGGGFEVRRRGISVWDLNDGSLKAELPAANPRTLLFDARGEHLLAGGSLYRVPDFGLVRTLEGAGQPAAADASGAAAVLLPDGDTYLTTAGRDVLRWSLRATPLHRTGHPLCETATGGSFSSDGREILLVTEGGEVRRLVTPDFQCEPLPLLGKNVVLVGHLDGRNEVLTLRANQQITLHDARSWVEKSRFTVTSTGINAVHWSTRYQRAGFRTEDERLEFWELDGPSKTWEVPLLQGRELSWATADGRVHQIQSDGRLFSYDPGARQVFVHQLDHTGMNRLAFSPDGRWLVTTSPKGERRLVDANTWKTVSTLESATTGSQLGVALWGHEPRVAFAGPWVVDRITGRTLLRMDSGFSFAGRVHVSKDDSTLVSVEEGRPHATAWWAPSWEEIRRAESAGSGGR